MQNPRALAGDTGATSTHTAKSTSDAFAAEALDFEQATQAICAVDLSEQHINPDRTKEAPDGL